MLAQHSDKVVQFIERQLRKLHVNVLCVGHNLLEQKRGFDPHVPRNLVVRTFGSLVSVEVHAQLESAKDAPVAS